VKTVGLLVIGLACVSGIGVRGHESPGDKAKNVNWKPNPELVGQLTQSATLDRYQISLPRDFTFAGSKKRPGNVEQFVWQRPAGAQGGAAILSIDIVSDKKNATATKDLRNALVSYWGGMFEASKMIDNPKRNEPEAGSINGISFYRFTWSGSMKLNQAPVKGLAYGAIDGDNVILCVGMNIGEDAEKGRQLMETVLATFKKK
jgi:hypothetical protein